MHATFARQLLHSAEPERLQLMHRNGNKKVAIDCIMEEIMAKVAYVPYTMWYMDSILSGIKRALAGIFSNKGDDRVVGIDIGTSFIKVVELRVEGPRAVLNTYGSLALGQYLEDGKVGQVVNFDATQLSAALIDVLRETKIETTNAVISIPGASCIIFIMKLPAVISDKDLPNVIPAEAKKFIPVPITDVMLDWYVIPRREDSGVESRVLAESGGEAMMSVLVVATLNETVAKYAELAQKAGLPANALEIEVFSHIRSVLSRELFPVLIVDMGASKTKLTIVEHGIVETFRLVNKGSQDLTNAITRSMNVSFEVAENLKKQYGLVLSAEHPSLNEIAKIHLVDIFQEINTTMLAYEKRYNKNIGKVVFTGGGSMLRGLLEHAKTSFSAELSLANPFSKVETPIFLDEVLKVTGPEFSVAIGLALKKMQ